MRTKPRYMFRKTLLLSLAVSVLLALLPVSAAAEAQKTVRVGYISDAFYEGRREDGYKSGASYEYLQKISYLTGWRYDYVYGTFQECCDNLASGEIDLLGNLSYTSERAALFDYSSYPQGEENYWLYADAAHDPLTEGDLSRLNGCRIGVTRGSYQSDVLADWLSASGIDAQIVPCGGEEMLRRALADGLVEAVVASDLSLMTDCLRIICIGSSEYYFAVSRQRPDLLGELNAALGEIQSSEYDYNGTLAHKYYHPVVDTELNAAEQAWLAAHSGTLRLGLLSDNLPYSERKADGSAGGVLTKLADNMTERLGVAVALRFYADSKALTAAMERGEVDVMGPVYGDFYLAEQRDHVLTDEMVSPSLLVIYHDKPFDAESGTLAVSNDTLMTEEVVRLLFPYAKALVCDNLEQCLEAVANDRADGMVVSSIRLNLLRKYSAMGRMHFADLPVSTGVCLATTKENRAAAAILNKGIALSADILTGGLLVQSSYVAPHTTWGEIMREHTVTVLLCSIAAILVLSLLLRQFYLLGKRTKRALEQAREASTAKSEFLSRMSHDIRTPMNAIINLTQLAQQEQDPNAVRRYVDKVEVSGRFLLGLINDILDMSKIESGELTLHEEPLTRDEFLRTIETVIVPLMDARQLHFHSETVAGRYTVLVDKLRLHQIVFNLLSNAAKFTPEGGDVWLEVRNLSGEPEKGKLSFRITVRDNGVGMSEEFLPHLFEPFVQEHSQLSDKAAGTGLGLPIVKSLVEAMGGTISVKSRPGEGTEFTVTLCVPVVPAQSAPAPQVEEAPDLTGLRVLLVEDNEINTYVARLLLEEVGCVVATAENGQQAVDAFAASAPFSIGAILMDIRMPVMDGLEATRTIRALARPDAASIPIIAMTADAFAEERKRTLEFGMNEHLSKPIDPKLLYAALVKYAARPAKTTLP